MVQNPSKAHSATAWAFGQHDTVGSPTTEPQAQLNGNEAKRMAQSSKAEFKLCLWSDCIHPCTCKYGWNWLSEFASEFVRVYL